MSITQAHDKLSAVYVPIAAVITFTAVIAAYWMGLDGPFLFDDFASIATLGSHGGVTDWETFKSFVFGGNAGPTGRPLAKATFLLDANNWPTEPWPFKRTNLLIHLINGTLLAALSYQILRLLEFENRQAQWVAIAAAGAWLLHPFLVSTTLYVVQRMTQLSAMFVFAGLVGYLYGRTRLEGDRVRAYLIMSCSLVLGTFLAVISKENGALLPLLALVLEMTVVASNQRYRSQLNRPWFAAFVILPAITIGLYLVYITSRADLFAITPPRDFSLYERALTQPRILTDYLYNWFIPKLYTTGVFQDHFLKSTALLSPVTTVLAIVLHGGLAMLALTKRREWPLFALVVLFFYGGHLVESTVVNLSLIHI